MYRHMLATPSGLVAPDDLGSRHCCDRLREGFAHTFLCIRDSRILINNFPTFHYILVHTNNLAFYPFDDILFGLLGSRV
jgi:hypothetical protein